MTFCISLAAVEDMPEGSEATEGGTGGGGLFTAAEVFLGKATAALTFGAFGIGGEGNFLLFFFRPAVPVISGLAFRFLVAVAGGAAGVQECCGAKGTPGCSCG